MALSNQTISNLASALVPEVIDYIYEDERWCEFLHEIVPDALKDKLDKIVEFVTFAACWSFGYTVADLIIKIYENNKAGKYDE